MNLLRIAAGAALLGLVALVGFAFVAALQRKPYVAEATDTGPVMDMADLDTRRVVFWLMHSDVSHFGGQWLGESCGYGEGEERLVLSRQVPAQGSQRALYLRMNDAGGNAFYSARPLGPGEPALGRAWLLQPQDVARVRQLLDDGGYYRLPPAGEEGFCHTEITSLETCVRGRYYGTMRMCEGVDEVSPTPLRDIAQSLEQLMDEVSKGETVRRAAAATEDFTRQQRSPSM